MYSAVKGVIYLPGGLSFIPADPKHFQRSVKGNRTVYLPPTGPGFYLEVFRGQVWVRWQGLEIDRTPYDTSFTEALKAIV